MKNTEPSINEAEERYLELYATPVVTNTYLKIAVLTLALVSMALLSLFYRLEMRAFQLKPLVIAVSDLGRGQVMQYDEFQKIPIDRVSKYYLARWSTLYYSRNHATLQRDFSESLDFFSNQLQMVTVAETKKSKTLDPFLLDPNQPNVDVQINAVVLEDLEKSPYRARIEFEKVFRSLGDQQETRRERWTANVVYSFRDQVPNRMLLTNPLGLVISYVHEDQAFGN